MGQRCACFCRLQSPAVTGSVRWDYRLCMGFLSRMLVPRGVRRAFHPTRAVKRAVTPKAVKQVRRAIHPVDNAVYGIARGLNTKPRSKSKAPRYRHGSCPVNHRTAEAAARCRKG